MTPTQPASVSIHEATCRADGSGEVVRSGVLTRAQAIAHRRAGGDVVVCGSDTMANAREAFAIESAVGPCKPDGPHADAAGAQALPHFQPKVRVLPGHTFYETPVRKAVVSP
jgi:hypothetical protein